MLLTLNKLLNNGNFIRRNRRENSYDLQALSFFNAPQTSSIPFQLNKCNIRQLLSQMAKLLFLSGHFYTPFCCQTEL